MTARDPWPDPLRDRPSPLAEHARHRPQAAALVVGERRLSHAELDAPADGGGDDDRAAVRGLVTTKRSPGQA